MEISTELNQLKNELQYSFDQTSNISVTTKSFERFSNNEDYIILLKSENSFGIPIRAKALLLKSHGKNQQYYVSFSYNSQIFEVPSNQVKFASQNNEKNHKKKLRRYFEIYDNTSEGDNISSNNIFYEKNSSQNNNSDTNRVQSIEFEVNQTQDILNKVILRKKSINNNYDNILNRNKIEDVGFSFQFGVIFSAYPLWAITDDYTDNLLIHLGIIILPNLLVFFNVAYHFWFKLQNFGFPILYFGSLLYSLDLSKSGFEIANSAKDICFYTQFALYLLLIYSIYQHYLNSRSQNEFNLLSNQEIELNSKLSAQKGELTKEKWRITPPKEKAKIKLEAVNDAIWNNKPSKAEEIYNEWENEIQKYFGIDCCRDIRASIKKEWENERDRQDEARRHYEEKVKMGSSWQCKLCGTAVHLGYDQKPLPAKCSMNSGVTNSGKVWHLEHKWVKMS